METDGAESTETVPGAVSGDAHPSDVGCRVRSRKGDLDGREFEQIHEASGKSLAIQDALWTRLYVRERGLRVSTYLK